MTNDNNADRIRHITDSMERTLEERGLMVCPFCDGTSGDDNLCHVCMGHRYIKPFRMARYIPSEDFLCAFEASRLTEEEQGWL